MKETIIGAVAVVALIVGSWALYEVTPHFPVKGFGTTSAGNLLAENYIPYVLYNGGYNSAKDLNITGGTTFGSSGTTFTQFQKGTCALIGMDVTQTGSTTKAYDCAVTGVVSGDVVVAQFATSTAPTGALGFTVTAAQASTTSGFITVLVKNLGAAVVPSATSQGSTTQYIIIR